MSRHYSKENPGCYHQLLNYLAILEDTPITITDVYINLNDLYARPTKRSKHKGLKYKSYNIIVEYDDGTTSPFILTHHGGQRFDKVINKGRVKHKVAVKFHCTRNKRLTEFKTKPNLVGNYKDSLGGGWYSNCQLYEINGQYFADMECTC